MVILVIFLLLLIFLFVMLFISYKMFSMSMNSEDKSYFNKSNNKVKANIDKTSYINEYNEWISEQDLKDAYIKSEDGYRLHANYLSSNNSYRTVICVHGYRSNAAKDFGPIVKWFIEHHTNVVLVDQRCCGSSEGKYITFGYYESKDLNQWVKYVESSLFPDKNIFLYGVSMGASTVLLSSKNQYSSNVKGFIADCGYSSLRNLFNHICIDWFHLPLSKILINISNMYCKLFAKFNIDDVNVSSVLTENKRPILFFHGTEDTYVIPENTRENFAACTKCKKEIVWVEKSNHAEALYVDHELYENKLEYFFESVENNTFKGE